MKVVTFPGLRTDPALLQIDSLAKQGPIIDRVIQDLGYDEIKSGFTPGRDLCKRVHSAAYVDGLASGAIRNGFGSTDPRLTLRALMSAGVMCRAAEIAFGAPGEAVMAPASGFHHAGYDSNYGYCTFNGLLMAVAHVRSLRRVPRVLIIDGDAHSGDGTDDILRRHDYMYNAYLSGVTNLTNMRRDTWLADIRNALRGAWDLILYQAGADAHQADPYGAGYLTDEDWRERDEVIFMHAARTRTPIAWCLAGGYNGQKTIDLHIATARVARGAARLLHFGIVDPTSEPVLQPSEQVAPHGRSGDDVGDEGGSAQR